MSPVAAVGSVLARRKSAESAAGRVERAVAGRVARRPAAEISGSRQHAIPDPQDELTCPGVSASASRRTLGCPAGPNCGLGRIDAPLMAGERRSEQRSAHARFGKQHLGERRLGCPVVKGLPETRAAVRGASPCDRSPRAMGPGGVAGLGCEGMRAPSSHRRRRALLRGHCPCSPQRQ